MTTYSDGHGSTPCRLLASSVVCSSREDPSTRLPRLPVTENGITRVAPVCPNEFFAVSVIVGQGAKCTSPNLHATSKPLRASALKKRGEHGGTPLLEPTQSPPLRVESRPSKRPRQMK